VRLSVRKDWETAYEAHPRASHRPGPGLQPSPLACGGRLAEKGRLSISDSRTGRQRQNGWTTVTQNIYMYCTDE
jgi:hypothetical protein